MSQMNTKADADNGLMVRVQGGDLAAFETLVDRYKQAVLNFVSRLLGDPVEAEDVAQNVFIQVFRNARGYQASAKFTTWLFTIARNLSLNEIRRRSRHPTCPLEPTPQHEGEPAPSQFEELQIPAPLARVLEGELVSHVEEAISRLPEAQRSAILMVCQQEMSYQEVAGVLGITLAATRSLIHRARERLKHLLRPYLRHGAKLVHRQSFGGQCLAREFDQAPMVGEEEDLRQTAEVA